MKRRFIPNNVIQGKRILGFRLPNLIEGAIAAVIFALIISRIPFVPKVKWIIIITVGVFLIVANGLGIKGQRYSQALINYYRYKKYVKQLSYRRLNFAPDEPEKLFETKKDGTTRVVTVHEQTSVGKLQSIFRL